MHYSDQSCAGFKVFEFAEGKVEEKRSVDEHDSLMALNKIFFFSFFWTCFVNILVIKILSIVHLYFEKVLQSLQIHHFCHKVYSSGYLPY